MNKRILLIKVVPNSHKTEIVGWEGDKLKVRIAAHPEKGEANQELITFLSKQFKIPKSDIEITTGASSRIKRVSILGDVSFEFL